MTPDFETIPAELIDRVRNAWSSLAEAIESRQFNDPSNLARFEQSAGKVLAASLFVGQQLERNPSLLASLLSEGDLLRPRPTDQIRALLAEQLRETSDEPQLMAALRRFRNREMVRIAWRDIAGWAEIEETLSDLTALAEACIGAALEWLFRRACEQRAVPLNRNGEPQRLLVLGMGKLGAWELNYSSDIDLIFAYEDEGVLTDRRETSFSEFYTRLARSLVKVLDEVTADGFVFRVDTRLRPFGDSGPLVMNFDAMEQYYQSQAREWERYAMVKARVIAGDSGAAEALDRIIRPFVYRRYLDYRAFGALRELKDKITRELQRKDRLDNVKLGPGGIREIEFIGQAFQLIRGGREKRLQQRRILDVLAALGELGQLPATLVARLREAYRFLRLVENRIQQYADRQTHDLPTDPMARAALAQALDFADWPAFLVRLDEVRQYVHSVFEQVIEAPQTSGDGAEIQAYLELDDSRLAEHLTSFGFEPVADALALVLEFRGAPAIRRITPQGVTELNRIFPLVLRAVAATAEPAATLGRILKLLEAIAGRNVYFTLLAENPLALSQLVKLSAASSWIAQFIASHPLLLDELMDPRTLYSPLSLAQLRQELQDRLARVDVTDSEALMTTLRLFKQTNVLRIAAADIVGAIPIMVVSDYLTWLAEAIVDQVLALAWAQTAQRHGVPPGSVDGGITGFAVIAYGKAGGIELSYASDLDLVFLYGGVDDTALTDGESPLPAAQFYARVAKRMISLLTTQLLSGQLYELDLRLRPSGSSGLLVSSLDAYETYQMESAWTWEQQALVRARCIAGDPAVADGFRAIRRTSLARPRDIDALCHEVAEMREKMRANLDASSADRFDLKQGLGGIADIEFIVQFGVLAGANLLPEPLLRWTDVVRLLDALRESGRLSADAADTLRTAYCAYRERTHRLALLEQPALVPASEYVDFRTRVQAIWQSQFGR